MIYEDIARNTELWFREPSTWISIPNYYTSEKSHQKMPLRIVLQTHSNILGFEQNKYVNVCMKVKDLLF